MAADRPDLKPFVGQKLTVIAWLWARTVKSPNPAFSHAEVPLASTFVLSSKVGKIAYVEPVVEGNHYRFTVKIGTPTEAAKAGTKAAGRGANFACVLSQTPIGGDYIKAEGKAGRMSARLMAIVAEGVRGRVYLTPTEEHEAIAQEAQPTWKPTIEFAKNSRHMTPWAYGLTSFGTLFTPRQLVALTTFSDLVQEVMDRCHKDSLIAGMTDDPNGLEASGSGALAYAQAIGVYLSFAIDRLAMTGNSLVRWNNVGEKAQHCFGRQALPMLWDFAEPNFLADATGSVSAAVFYSYDPISHLPATPIGSAQQADAQGQAISQNKVVSSDPPYYDNVPYADLSDFFYVWLRKCLKPAFPNLYATLAVPKAEELVFNCTNKHC